MAELKCKDGTVIKISNETEAELRDAFGPKPKPSYKDYALEVYIDINDLIGWPVAIKIVNDHTGDNIATRNVKDTEAFIKALQEAVAYCEQHDLGL